MRDPDPEVSLRSSPGRHLGAAVGRWYAGRAGYPAEGTPVGEVAKQMLRYDIDHIPVVREGVPVGIVSRHDLLRMIVRQAEAT